MGKKKPKEEEKTPEAGKKKKSKEEKTPEAVVSLQVEPSPVQAPTIDQLEKGQMTWANSFKKRGEYLREIFARPSETKMSVKDVAAKPFEFIMSFTSDPEKDAQRAGYSIEGVSKVKVFQELMFYLVFLGFFFTAIFARMDLEQPYRTQYAMRVRLFKPN